jgi:hypothetical protein
MLAASASSVSPALRGARIALLGAVVAVSLLAAPGAVWADRPCDPMPVAGFTTPATPPAPPERPGPGLTPVSLPVVVHYMRITGSGNEVETRFRPETLIELFGESGTINAIWRQAGVRLYLHRFERCAFRFADFGLDENANGEIDSPARSAEGKERFRRINERFNAPDVRGVDLYVWSGINQNSGYGDRWLDTGKLRAGAAWVDTDCLEDRHVACDLLLAHEIGHFLGLCHSCMVGEPLPRVPCTRCLPASMRKPNGSYTLKSCSDVPTRIMRSDNLKTLLPHTVNGTELNDCERRLANSFASKRLTTKTTIRGGTAWVAEASASCRETRSTW